MSDYKLIRVNLGFNELEPVVFPKPWVFFKSFLLIKFFKIKKLTTSEIRLPMINTNIKYNDIGLKKIIYAHEK